MKEVLLNIGFLEKENEWFYFKKEKFYIELCNSEDPYFFIYTFMSEDRDSAPHPFYSIEKLELLITAYSEYFK